MSDEKIVTDFMERRRREESDKFLEKVAKADPRFAFARDFNQLQKDQQDKFLVDYAATMGAREKAYGLLVPVVKQMRKMGLTTLDIGRMFKFLGDEFCKPDE
jgi:hypothetical protein